MDAAGNFLTATWASSGHQGTLPLVQVLMHTLAAASRSVGLCPGSSGKTGEGGREDLQKMANWLLKMETPRCTAVPRHQQS